MAAATGNGSQARVAVRTSAQATTPAQSTATRAVPRWAMACLRARNSSTWAVAATGQV